MKLCIIGAGSSYTPELIEPLAIRKAALPIEEIMLMDVDEKRLDIMHGFCQRFAKHLGSRVALMIWSSLSISLLVFVMVSFGLKFFRRRSTS